MRLLALLAFSLPALAQFRVSDIAIYPSSNDVSTGQLQFLTRRADGKLVTIQAPTTATASYTLTLPTAAPASNGHCLTGTTAGVLSFAACPGVGAVLTTTNQEVEGYKYFGVAGSDRVVMYQVSNNLLGIQTMLDGQTDPTTYAYGGVNNQLLLQPREGVVGVGAINTSFLFNVGGTFRAAGAVTLASTLAVAGVTTLSGDLRFGTDNTHAIGETGTRPSVIYSRVNNTAKLEVQDLSGGFWDQRVNATGTTSNWILRDNAGSRALAYTRVFSSSPDNAFEVFGALLPAQRATGSGDAVNDSTAPALGATARRWSAVWADEGTFTSEVKAPTFTASADFTGAVNNVTNVGTSSVRMANVWTYGLDAVGAIKLKSSSTIGQVWTATGTDGSGDWATPGTSQWTTTGSDIYFSAGKVGIGNSSPAHQLDVTGSAKVYSGSGSTDSILYIGNGDVASPGQGAFLGFIASAATPYFSINALSQGVAFRDVALANLGGSVCVGCTSPSTKLDVSGTFRATGAATFGSTSTFAGAVAVGSTDLTTATLFSRAADVNGLRIHNSGTPSPSGGAGIQAAIETAPASGDRLAFYAFGLRTGGANYNGANITAWATQNWSAGSAQGTELRFETTANGAASRTASVVVNAAGLAVAGTATVSGITTFGGSLAASATDTHDIGSSSRFRNIYGQAVNAANIEVANGITVTSFWRHNLNSASAYEISSGSASQLEVRLETLSSTNSGAGFRGTLYPLNVGGSNGDLGYSGTPWRTLYLSTGLRLTAGAAAGRVLTSNGSGDGTWEPLGACATCVTTNTNQTITGTKTFTASIAATTTDAYDIGSSTRFRNIYGQAVNAANIEVANGITVTSFWRHNLNSASAYEISSGSASQLEVRLETLSSTNSGAGFRGTLYPLNVGGSNGDLGYSGTPWRTLYLSTSAFMNGTQWMDSSRNLTNLGTGTFSGAITANGGISTASGTNSTIFVGSGNFYIRTFSGGDASCSGVTDGWIGFRTDTNELQVCNGGATRKVAM